MASSSSLLMALSKDQNHNTKAQTGSAAASKQQLDHQPPKAPRGRKPSKPKSPLKKNKQPQRGMGVEQLERRRIQELLVAKMPEKVGLLPQQLQPPALIPAASGAGSGYGGNGSDQLSRSLMAVQKVDIGGGSCGNVTRDWVGGILESSREISSMPKLPCDQCEICSKKKRLNFENQLGFFSGAASKDKQLPSMISPHVFTGLGHRQNVAGLDMTDFNTRAMRQIYHMNKEAEMMGFQGQGASMGSGRLMKEYEFFPGGKSLKEFEFFPGTGTSSLSTTSYEQQESHPFNLFESMPYNNGQPAPSYFHIPSSQNNAPPPSAIDLSLKLSF